jgi:hypothetical protein
MANVRIGFFSFTEVTDPAEHRSYNEWHQLDHMPEQFPIPGVVFGQRWVSTPAGRRARAFDDPALASIHYMTHEHRRSHLSGPFAVTGLRAASRVLVSAESIPFRPNLGLYVVVRTGRHAVASDQSTPVSAPEQHDGAEDPDVSLAGALLEADGVAGVWTFTTDGRSERHGWRPGEKTITVCYLDAPPLSVAPRLGDVVRAAVDENSWSVVFAGPLETITPWNWDWFDGDT